ncbi:hypothetical protein V5799_020931 [Amblyomma americanum]|uniref:Uncharacterized protein n=1 Tax=Amblyomma americanum TaxID=6943 RepID=A0AAQ4ESJ0_AMBAM
MEYSISLKITAAAILMRCTTAKRIDWCGGPQNPLESAKTARVATTVFLACKNETLGLNISPSFFKESNRLCAIWRMCYSLVEDTNVRSNEYTAAAAECSYKFGKVAEFLFPKWKQEYNFDEATFYDALKRCAIPHLPKGVMYGLKSVDYFRYFASG